MDPQDVFRQMQGQNSFGMSQVPYHTHNGTDSPLIYSPTIQYTGFVPDNADLSGTTTGGFVFFPAGWSVEHTATGLYTITHNLDTPFYTTMVTLSDIDVGGAESRAINFNTYIEVATFDINGDPADISFDFLVTVVNNSAQSIPQYTTLGS